MPIFKRDHIPFTLVCLFLVVFTTACSSLGTSTSAPADTPTTSTNVQPPPTATKIPTVSTTCPATGKGRAAVLPSFHPGTDQNIVYFTGTALKRYNVQTKTTTTIIKGTIGTAQISQDGQWILLGAVQNSVLRIQVVRIDGKYRQTLYCVPQGQLLDGQGGFDPISLQWSLDQKQIIFSLGTFDGPISLYLLDTSSGAVQPILDKQAFLPVAWLNSTQIYVKSSQQPFKLYLLDTSKGAHQHINDMKLVWKSAGENDFWDFDISPDSTTLFVSMVTSSPTDPYGPSTIDVVSIDGKINKKILSSRNVVISNIRFINASSLMFVSFEQSGTQEQAKNIGWWKINTDGSGLTHLNRQPNEGGAGPGTWGPFNPFSQTPWSNFSRNGSLYTDGTSYGSLNGGALTNYVSDDSGATLVGWATM